MNIAITTHVNPAISNGLGQYIRFLIKALEEADTNHSFFILVNKEFDKFLSISHPNFVKVRIDIPHNPRILMRPIYFYWQNLLIDSFFRKHKIDVFHLPNPVPLFNTHNVPYVVTIHDMAEFNNFRHKSFHRSFRLLSYKLSAENSTMITTVSRFTKSEILKFLDIKKEKIKVIYPGLTLDINKQTDNKKVFKEPFFLHVGGSRNNKNIERIIEAFLMLNIQSKVKLYFLGTITHLKKSKKEMKRLEESGIFFIGQVSEEDLIAYYREAIALVYPSLYEGFGLPILEAMYLGLPVITSNRCSMPEVGGDNVIYVNPESTFDISMAMKKIWLDKNLVRKFVEDGRERAKLFDWKDTAYEMLTMYENAGKQK